MFHRVLQIVSFAAAITLSTTTVVAQQNPPDTTPRDSTARDLLLEQAQRFREQGNHQGALDAALRAATMRVSPSLRLFIAQEHLQVHQPARAYVSALRCSREVQGDSSIRNGEAILRECNALAEQARQQTGFVLVRPPSPAPAGLVVRVGEETIPAELLSQPFPMNPGEIRITATAPNMRPFEEVIVTSPGQTHAVTLWLAASASDSNRPSREIPTQSPAPWIVAGIGGAVVATGAVLLLVGETTTPVDCQLMGNDYFCTSEFGERQANERNTLLAAGWSVFSVGLAATTVGVFWGALSRTNSRTNDDRAQASPWQVRPFHTPTAGGMTLGTRF